MFKFAANIENMAEDTKQWPLTVAPELHETWKRLRRKGDPETIAKELGVSRPVIDRALIYGHVTMSGVSDKISKFFELRLINERKTAKKLNDLADSPQA